MNKQEAIEKIEKGKSNFNAWEDLVRNRAFEDALTIVRKIDEPEKPVVPQFVADWYENNEYDFEYNLYRLCTLHTERKLFKELDEWFDNDDNKPIETLVMMHKFGYEVEKEKLYTVEIPNPNGFIHLVLCKDCDGKIFVTTFSGVECWTTYGKCKLTESEIRKDFDWAWEFAEVVKE
ncbi:DUF1642 domain-containing protein [Streptococcus sp.]|uniref:DUF1642 domain-containing protein n=1 Tax=Streptococcus sp. TaxID=1306 RepID=UPI003AF0404E